MIQITFPAMGTGIDAWCPDPESAAELRNWFEEVESVCSRFRPDSELSRVNRSAHGEVVVSGLLSEVLADADRLRSLTGGLVDVGVGMSVSPRTSARSDAPKAIDHNARLSVIPVIGSSPFPGRG